MAVLLTALTNYQLSQALEDGQLAPAGLGLDSAFRLAREIILWGLALLMLNGVVAHKRRLRGGGSVSPKVLAALLAIIASIAATLIAGGAASAILTGLRFAPFAVMLAAVPHYAADERYRIAITVAKASALLLIFEAAVAARQTVMGVPAFFGETFIGPRPFGTLATPNLLGLTALAVAILYAVTKPSQWKLVLTLALAVTVVSGSRSAVLGMVLLLLGAFAGRIRFRWLLVPSLLGVAFLAYRGTNTQAVSGRLITGEGRVEVWLTSITTSLQGPLEWLVGAGVGTGTNAASTLAGEGPDAVINDSTFVAVLLSFGLLGLVAAFAAIAHLAKRMDGRRWLIAPPVLLVALTVNVPEVAPFNVLAMAAVAACLPSCGCGTGHSGPRRLAPLTAIPHKRDHDAGASGGA